MRVDSHQHFWKTSRGDYGWLTPDLKPIYRDFNPEDLMVHLEKNKIDKTIVVQAAPTVEETEYLLDLYETYDVIAGVVGWIDLESSDFKEQYQRLRKNRGFVGLRPMLQDLEDDQWILRQRVLSNLEIVAEDDFPIDILIYPRHLPHILELLNRFSNLRAVIDHIAKPNIAQKIMEPWKEQISQIASYPNVMCKLSGMITEADHKNWKAADLNPYVRHVVDVFGTASVMYGSDWPVCLLAGSYDQVYDSLQFSLPEGITEEDRNQIFGENAIRFYKLNHLINGEK